MSKKKNIPENQIIKNPVEDKLDKVKQAEYIQSFQKASNDIEMQSLSDEGLEDYFKVLTTNY